MKCRMPFTLTLLVSHLLILLTSVAIADEKTLLWESLASSAQKPLNHSGTSSKSATQLSLRFKTSFENARFMRLNKSLLKSHLGISKSLLSLSVRTTTGDVKEAAEKPSRVQANNLSLRPQFDIDVPLSDGSISTITVTKDTVLADELMAKFPDIQTFRVLANDKVFSGKLDISDSGFHGMLQLHTGETVFIDPIDSESSVYAIYKKSDQKLETGRQFSCGVDHADKDLNESFRLSARSSQGEGRVSDINSDNSLAQNVSQNSLINYRIAVATTSEYSAKFGSLAKTLAAITTTISRVNQVLERDLGIHLTLVSNNDLLIADTHSDSFSSNVLFDLVLQNQDYIDAIIGKDNYDVGHLFTTSGGGLAAIASVCHQYNKAKGVSGVSSPLTDSFDIDFVAHEIGHQLGATHTFNSAQGACSESTRTARSAFEPGSGSTIMSYAGHCGLDNIQTRADAMYHIGSIKQISNYTQNGFGSRCGVKVTSNNAPPEVEAGNNYAIPARTPFELLGEASDNDDDSLIYAWQQLDAGTTSVEYADRGDNALFRVHLPNASAYRSFPPLKDILQNRATRGETLPSTERVVNLSFVAQDGFNPAQSDEMKVNVKRTGSRFALHYPKTYYERGETYPLFWNVANTNQAPINCSSVNIWLSTNGGDQFNHLLASNVSNTGVAQVTIPVIADISSQGRFKLKCADNIFYAISYRNFFVTDDGDTINVQYSDENMPEANLEDIDPSLVVAQPISIDQTNNQSSSSSSGGGVFDYGFLCLMLLFRQKQFLVYAKHLF